MQTSNADPPIDPVGEEMYDEVLRKPLFDEKNPPPLSGVRELTVNHLFAKIWSRSRVQSGETPALTLHERRLVTIALLAAQGRTDQLKEHVTGAFKAKVARESLIELMIHVAHYAGWAAGSSGQHIVREVYDNKGDKNSQ